METKKITGDTNYEVSVIGFGCAAIGGYDYGSINDKDSLNAINEAWNSGINLFDISDIYGLGNAERILSAGLGKNCKDAIISSKFGLRQDNSGEIFRDSSVNWLEQALHGSLKRLNIEQIPIYLIHWYDEKTPLEELISSLQKYKSQGKIGRYGACNLSSNQYHEFYKLGGENSLQLPFSLVDKSYTPLFQEASRGERSLTMAYDVLGRGILTGKYNDSFKFSGTDTRPKHKYFKGENLKKNLKLADKLKNIANAHGVTPAQVAIRWVVDMNFVDVALVGCKTPDQVLNNVDIFNFDISKVDKKALFELAC
tara:strand:- start:554 stop:1486 length:933 start_codon:yes stop_codon:yes gene_type:complete